MSMTFGFISPYVISSVRAQEATLTDTLSREARLYTVTNALVACFQGQTGEGLSSETTTNNLSSELPVFINQKVFVGHHVKPSDGNANCNDASWVSSAVNMVGFSSNTAFMNLFYEKNSGNFWQLKVPVASGEVNVINQFLNKSIEGGNTTVTCTPKNGCTVSISDAAKYVLYLENLKKGCGATEVNNEDDINSIDEDKKAVIKVPNANAILEEKVYKMDKGKGKFIDVGQGLAQDGNLSCGTLIDKINQYASGFNDRLVQAKNNNQDIGDLSSLTSTGSGENEESCEERMKLSAGWIVCSGLELLSSGMDTLFGYIDSLLNVNVIKLNASDDQGLYKSWSYFRGIATFMLFAVGLVMIIGQAVGGGKN